MASSPSYHARDEQSEDTTLYPSGARALEFKEDGSGFIYYPSGRVAVCKGVVNGRDRYYIYGDDVKSTPLGAINEHAVGFFTGESGARLALNKAGGLLTDEQGYITREWRYDLGAHMPPPTGVVLTVKLNRSISFEFQNRAEMLIKFAHDGVLRDFRAGVRPKREGSYLDTSIRLPGGRLEPQLNRLSLVSRQVSFGSTMKAKRDRLKPRSRNLAGDFKTLVAGLERRFDGMCSKVEPFPQPSWKIDAREATVGALPRIRSTGMEVGPMQGLGSTIYSAVAEDEDNVGLRRSSSWGGAVRETWANDDARLSGGTPVGARTPAGVGKLKKGGKWLSDLDVRRQIAAENPLLKRSSMLQSASGRYAEEIVVPGGKTSASNPTGKAVVPGLPLRTISASRLDVFIEEEAGSKQLVVVLCVRSDEPLCCRVQHVAEITNRFLLGQHGGCGRRSVDQLQESSSNNKLSTSSSTSLMSSSKAAAGAEPYQMVRVDFGECQATADKHGVKSMPAFLMFFGGRLAWAGTLGGVPIKAAPPETADSGYRVLLVEPCAKAQLVSERALRKHGCDWDLVLTAAQALSRNQAARTRDILSHSEAGASDAGDGGGYGMLMMSDSLSAADVVAIEKAFHGGGSRSRGPLIVGLADVRGDPALLPSAALDVASVGFTNTRDGCRAVLSPHLALIADAAATKPLRASALKAMFQHCAQRAGEMALAGCGGGGSGGGEEGGGWVAGADFEVGLGCITLEGGDHRYKGVTPSRLLEKMESTRKQAALGKLAVKQAAGAGAMGRLGPGPVGAALRVDVLVSAQETEYRGLTLEKSTMQYALS